VFLVSLAESVPEVKFCAVKAPTPIATVDQPLVSASFAILPTTVFNLPVVKAPPAS